MRAAVILGIAALVAAGARNARAADETPDGGAPQTRSVAMAAPLWVNGVPVLYGGVPDAGDTSTLSSAGPNVSPGPQVGSGPGIGAGPQVGPPDTSESDAGLR